MLYKYIINNQSKMDDIVTGNCSCFLKCTRNILFYFIQIYTQF